MQRLFDEYRDKYETLPSPSPSPTPEPSSEAEIEPSGKRPSYYDKFNRLSVNVITKKRRVATKEDDYTRYIKYFDPATWKPVHDVVGWWEQHRNDYPILSRLAFDVLSIPGMSAEVERVFSQAGRLITDARNGMSDDTIEACQIQHHGLKNSVF